MSNVTTPSDHDLLRLMAAGDEEAFATLYRRHQGQLYRFALLMSGSPAVADDITQEVFLALMRDRERYDATRGPLAAFLYGIARHQVLRCLRRESAYNALDEKLADGAASAMQHLIALDDPFADLVESEMINAVRQAVLALPARYREVIVLCDFQELSYAEAALALDCALGTVSSRLNRARALLADRLRALGKVETAELGVSPLRCLV
jgi:RNA polymerase sigma-70 factor, ECF subfamily